MNTSDIRTRHLILIGVQVNIDTFDRCTGIFYRSINHLRGVYIHLSSAPTLLLSVQTHGRCTHKAGLRARRAPTMPAGHLTANQSHLNIVARYPNLN